MKALSPIPPATPLSCNRQRQLINKVSGRFREGCKENLHTRWLSRKQLLSKNASPRSFPLTWKVELQNRGALNVIPDAIVGFKVIGSNTRIVLLCLDNGELPVESNYGCSLMSRVTALVTAATASVPGHWHPLAELRPGRIIVSCLLQNAKRLAELKSACSKQGYSWIYFTDYRTFWKSDNVLFIKWEQCNQPASSLI